VGLFLYLDKYFLTTEIKMRLPVPDTIETKIAETPAAPSKNLVSLPVLGSPDPVFLVGIFSPPSPSSPLVICGDFLALLGWWEVAHATHG